MYWQSLSETAWQFIVSDPFDTVVAAAFGAFFGAWGAQVIISRNQTKQAVIAELNSVSAALMLCFSICNRFVSLKKQHVRPLRDQYMGAKRALDDFLEAAKTHTGPQPPVFEFSLDLRTITPVKVPTEMLNRSLFEKISIRGRALAAAVDLVGAIDGLDKTIRYRNDLIEEVQKGPPLSHEERAQKYFGQKTEEGIIDERFPSSVEGIYVQTDDCIFFSRILADDLFEYGMKLRNRYAWKFRLRTPKLSEADWSIAEKDGLIPPTEQYKNWLQGFKKRPTTFNRLTIWVRSLWGRRPWANKS